MPAGKALKGISHQLRCWATAQGGLCCAGLHRRVAHLHAGSVRLEQRAVRDHDRHPGPRRAHHQHRRRSLLNPAARPPHHSELSKGLDSAAFKVMAIQLAGKCDGRWVQPSHIPHDVLHSHSNSILSIITVALANSCLLHDQQLMPTDLIATMDPRPWGE